MAELLYENGKSKIKDGNFTKTNKIEKYKMDDCKKIKKAFEEHGLIISLGIAHDLYACYSEYTYCSSWTNGIEVLSENDIFYNLYSFISKIDIQ